MTIAKLTDDVIRAGANDKSFQRGRELFRSGAISNAAIQGHTLSGECEGSGSPFYKVCAELDGGGIRSATCSCPYDFGGYCKHIVALRFRKVTMASTTLTTRTASWATFFRASVKLWPR